MHEKTEMLHELCDTISRELEEANEKIRKAGGTLSAGDVDYIDKLTHTLKSIKTTIAMIEAEEDGGYSGQYMPHYGRSYTGTSYSRGRYARRDSMGRYAGRMYMDDDSMLSELHELMDKAPDDRTRRKLENFINEMKSM